MQCSLRTSWRLCYLFLAPFFFFAMERASSLELTS